MNDSTDSRKESSLNGQRCCTYIRSLVIISRSPHWISMRATRDLGKEIWRAEPRCQVLAV
jgi:hypothetical protein